MSLPRFLAALLALAPVFVGAPSAQVLAASQLSATVHHKVEALGDIDGNGFVDIAVVETDFSFGGPVRVHFLGAGGTIASSVQHANSHALAALGDLDRDGTPDYAAINRLSGDLDVRFLNPDGTVRTTISTAPTCPTAFEWSLEALGDVDGDLVCDLALGHEGCLEVVFLNRDGTVKGSTSSTLARSYAFTSAGDLDQNGVHDLYLWENEVTGGASTGLFHGQALLESDGTVGSTVEGFASNGRERALSFNPHRASGCTHALAWLCDFNGLNVEVLEGPSLAFQYLIGHDLYEIATIGDVGGDGCPDAIGVGLDGIWFLTIGCAGAALPNTVVHNGTGANALRFEELNPAWLGDSWDVRVDLAGTGALASLVAIGFGGPTQGIQLAGLVQGELLCLPPFAMPLSTALDGLHSIPLPAHPAYLGLTYCAQGATFAIGSVQLVNALEFTIACR